MPKLQLTPDWDKIYPKSDKVDHEKITFHNHYGIELAADLFKPKGATAPFSAIALAGPFGAVKEQSSGLYAQELAERGYLTIAFDPSFTGESGGSPRYVASPEINSEDFSAAVDYLSCRDDVNPEHIGILGVCGFGGMALSAASNDPRIKATVASTMYNMSRVHANGYFDADDNAEARNKLRAQIAAQRTADYKAGDEKRAGGFGDEEPQGVPDFVKDYFWYYRKKAYHPRSANSTDGWIATFQFPFLNFPLLTYIDEIENPVMLVHGENAHSLYFAKDAYEKMKGGVAPDNKELIIVPGANHVDLYDQMDKIPFDAIDEFFGKYLK